MQLFGSSHPGIVDLFLATSTFITSSGTVIPLLLLLVLVIYYLVSLTGALREANNDLKVRYYFVFITLF